MTNTGFSKTTFPNQCAILSELWQGDFPPIQWFYDEYEVTISMAHAIANGYVIATPLAEDMVADCFNAMLKLVNVNDIGFESLEDIDAAVALTPQQEEAARELSSDDLLDILRGDNDGL